LPERRFGSKIFAGTAFHRVPAPLFPTKHNVRKHFALRAMRKMLRNARDCVA